MPNIFFSQFFWLRYFFHHCWCVNFFFSMTELFYCQFTENKTHLDLNSDFGTCFFVAKMILLIFPRLRKDWFVAWLPPLNYSDCPPVFCTCRIQLQGLPTLGGLFAKRLFTASAWDLPRMEQTMSPDLSPPPYGEWVQTPPLQNEVCFQHSRKQLHPQAADSTNPALLYSLVVAYIV